MTESELQMWQDIAPPVRNRDVPRSVVIVSVQSPRGCPYCGSRSAPYDETRVSQAGWVMFYLSLFSCIGLVMCWIPLVFMREEVIYCSRCEMRLR